MNARSMIAGAIIFLAVLASADGVSASTTPPPDSLQNLSYAFGKIRASYQWDSQIKVP